MKKVLLTSLIVFLCFVSWVGFRGSQQLPEIGKNNTSNVMSKKDTQKRSLADQGNNSDLEKAEKTDNSKTEQSNYLPNELNQEFNSLFAMAQNQKQAMSAIHKGYEQRDPAAISARAALAGACRMITLKPEIFSKVRESWYKTQLFKYCDGYDDVLDEHAFDELLNHNRTQGIKTRVFAKMRSIEKKQGVETALLEAENILKTEQDPFAAQNLLEYMGELERVGKAPIASNLPAGASLVYQPRDAMQLASEFAYCELAGGCGPYHLRTLRLCAGDIACPPGTTLRDFYGFVSPPVLVQAADVILARWRSLRQCGQYQCSR